MFNKLKKYLGVKCVAILITNGNTENADKI